MVKIIEAEARITAVDATGDTFTSIANKVRGVASAMKSLSGVATSGVGNINKTIGSLQRAISTLAPLASGAAAMEGVRGIQGLIHETVKATAERVHEAVRMDVSGMSKAEIAEAERVSGELSERYKALSQTTIMHALRNMRAIVGTYEEAGKILDPVLKLRIAAMGAHPEREGELAEDFDKFIKGMEIKGVTMDPAKFTSYMQGMAKAINVFGDTLNPTDYYQMFKYGRQSTLGLSEKFMLETAPTLAQELGGSSAGKAMSSFYQAIVGGRIKEQSVKELAALGLVDPAHVVRTKTGSIKGLLPGGVRGWQTAASDPYAWVNDVLLPALHSHGINSQEQIQSVISTIFQQATAAQMAGIFATQQPRIQKDWNLVHGAKGLDAADIYLSKDPYIAMQGVTEQFHNLLAIAGGPLAEPAARAMNEIAAGIVAMEHATKDHPLAATGIVGAGALALAGGSLAATLWALRGVVGYGKSLVTRGAATAAEDMSGAAAIRAMQSTMPEAVAGSGWLASVLGPAALLSMLPEAALAASHVGGWAQDKFGDQQTIGTVPGVGWVPGADKLSGLGVVSQPAEVKGSADLNVSVQVEPSENFLVRIITAIRNEINAFGAEPGSGVGTTGSTGLSMPQATPNP